MTLQPSAHRRDVLFASGHLGYSGTLTNTLPDDSGTSSSGNGTASTGSNGTDLEPGTTAGDSARLIGPISGTTTTPGFQRLAVSFSAEFDSFPPTDDFVFGYGRPLSENRGPYVDLTDEKIRSRAEETALDSSIWAAGSSGTIAISQYPDRDETEFLIQTEQGSQKEILNGVEFDSRSTRVYANSNGVGEWIRLFAIVETFGVIQ